jgi:uncharacterized RDD family membrane protein YckC
MKCASHVEIDAAGVCIKCGRGVCAQCKREMGGKTYCLVCADVYSQLQPEAVSTGGKPYTSASQTSQPSSTTFVATSEFGGFGRRLAAYLIDGIILSIIGLPIRLLAPHAYSYGVSALISLVYLIGFWSWKGQTPGKMALGVKIVDANGKPIGFGRAILRYFGYFVSAIVLLLGFIMIAFDGRKQGLHDKIAGTFVVRT